MISQCMDEIMDDWKEGWLMVLFKWFLVTGQADVFLFKLIHSMACWMNERMINQYMNEVMDEWKEGWLTGGLTLSLQCQTVNNINSNA